MALIPVSADRRGEGGIAPHNSGDQCRHLIEQPMLAVCSGGPRPVAATCAIASNSSRR
jgi:hypothetical protein